MHKTRKFLLVSMGGVAALMIIGMVVAALTDTSAEEVKSLNLIAELTWYRVAFFVAIVAAWPGIARYATRLPDRGDMSEEEWLAVEGKHAADFKFMRSQWWKVALLLAFVEIVLIQQFGIGR